MTKKNTPKKSDGGTPGNDPKAAQREAKELKPNQDTEEERSDTLGREFESTNEHDLESEERQHEPLTDPEDNAEVDRVVPDSVSSGSVASGPVVSARADSSPAATASATGSSPTVSKASPRPVVVRQPEARPYLMSPAALRNLFIASSVAGVALIVVILTLASSGNNARYTPADETQYQRTLQEAIETITTGVDEGGTARIPIEEAMAVVAAQGLGPVNASLAAPPEGAAADQPATEQPAPNQAAAEQTAPAQTDGEPDQEAATQPAQAQALNQPAPNQPAQAQTDQAQPETPAPAQAAAAVVDTAAGQTVYETNCGSCHQATGAGLPGAFPPLVGHVPALYNADRSYLINLLLYGLQGEIQVEGQTYNGVMAAWQQLSDDDIAATLNYVSTAWDNEGALENFQPFEAGEIAAARDAALSADDVYVLRQELGLSGDE